MRDLVEMCVGVQHPVRGLFVRAYLMQMMKDKLPDRVGKKGKRDWNEVGKEEGKRMENGKVSGREVGGEGDEEVVERDEMEDGTVEDSIEFAMRNLTEMNRLWVRLAKSTTTKYAHRRELRLLVGSNLATLSRLGSLDERMYSKLVFPMLSEQIVSCGDAMAQEYLCDCTISCFPPSFHMATLDEMLQMCGRLTRKTNLRPILTALMGRVRPDRERARKLMEYIPVTLREHGGCACVDRLLIYDGLLKFVTKTEDRGVDMVNEVLGFVGEELDGRDEKERSKEDEEEEEGVVMEMLSEAVSAAGKMGQVLKMECWVKAREKLGRKRQEEASASLLRGVEGYEKCVKNEDMVKKLLRYVQPLVEGEEVEKRGDSDGLSRHHRLYFPMYGEAEVERAVAGGKSKDVDRGGDESMRKEGEKGEGADGVVEEEEGEEEEGTFEVRQRLVARCVYYMDDEDVVRGLELLKALGSGLRMGGSKRLVLTYPSLVAACCQLCLRATEERRVERVGWRVGYYSRAAQVMIEWVSELEEASAVQALRCYVETGMCLSSALGMAIKEGETRGEERKRSQGLIEDVYTCVSRALVVHEDGVIGQGEELRCLRLLICCIGWVGETEEIREDDRWKALRDRVAKYASRLLTRGDQCVGHIACTDLYVDDHKLAAQCLERGKEAALRCVNSGDRLLFVLDVLEAGVRIEAMVGGENRAKSDRAEISETVHKLIRVAKKLLIEYEPQDGALMRVARGRFDRALSADVVGGSVEDIEWG